MLGKYTICIRMFEKKLKSIRARMDLKDENLGFQMYHFLTWMSRLVFYESVSKFLQ